MHLYFGAIFYSILYFLYCLGHSRDSLFCFLPQVRKTFPPNSLFWLYCGWITFASDPPLTKWFIYNLCRKVISETILESYFNAYKCLPSSFIQKWNSYIWIFAVNFSFISMTVNLWLKQPPRKCDVQSLLCQNPTDV